jgi:hypothetical protein
MAGLDGRHDRVTIRNSVSDFDIVWDCQSQSAVYGLMLRSPGTPVVLAWHVFLIEQLRDDGPSSVESSARADAQHREAPN